jgi:hypothetical protein
MRPGTLLAASLSAAVLTVSTFAQNADLKRHLRDTYEGKVEFLRGFYSDDKLHYPADGSQPKASAGDWTVDGLVFVSKVSISGHRLSLKGGRVLVSGKGGFQFGDISKKGLDIKADLAPGEVSQASAEAALAKIFLTDRDDFSNLLPEYWKPCIQSGLTGGKSACIFSDRFHAIPGLTAPRQGVDLMRPVDANLSYRSALARVGSGVTPPILIFKPDPNFSEAARKAK